MAEPMARVMRDGREAHIQAQDLVPGDIVLVGEGERLPADCVLRAGDALVVDKSALTGESAPVAKSIGADATLIDALPDPGGENTPFAFSGTLIARGSAVAEVVRTGSRTAIGRIGTSLATIEPELTPLQKTTGTVIAWVGGFAMLVLRRRHRRLRHGARRLGRGRARWNYFGDRPSPRRIPNGAHDFSGARRMASGATQGARAPQRGDGNLGLGLRPVRGQDRHADRKSHVGQGALRRRQRRAGFGKPHARVRKSRSRRVAGVVEQPGRSHGSRGPCARRLIGGEERGRTDPHFSHSSRAARFHSVVANRERLPLRRQRRSGSDLPPRQHHR